MNVITFKKEQLQAFMNARFEPFIDEIIQHIRAAFPGPPAKREAGVLRRQVTALAEMALESRIESEHAVVWWVELLIGFDDPLAVASTPGVREILGDQDLPEETKIVQLTLAIEQR